MKTKNIIFIAFLVLSTSIVSCKKDHDIPTGEVFHPEHGGDTLAPGGAVNHEFVDLGLPSGILWATCNVGADTPEGYGVYFAWGETHPKNVYDWNTYKHCNGAESTLTKYCCNSNYGNNGYTDVLTTLSPEDDAATANWGTDWRMPTAEEWRELYQRTTNTWTSQNGVMGRLFTAINGNSLFIPAAGYYIGGSLYNNTSNAYYWSSSLVTVNPNYAWGLGFDRVEWSVSNCHRDEGQSVRAVRVSQALIH